MVGRLGIGVKGRSVPRTSEGQEQRSGYQNFKSYRSPPTEDDASGSGFNKNSWVNNNRKHYGRESIGGAFGAFFMVMIMSGLMR